MSKISYLEFYNRCCKKFFNVNSEEELKNEFIYYVDKKDYRKADLDEIVKYLYNNVIKK